MLPVCSRSPDEHLAGGKRPRPRAAFFCEAIVKVRAAIELHLTRDQYEACLKNGMAISKLVPLKEGARTLRILGLDRGNAAVGSLIIPLAQVR